MPYDAVEGIEQLLDITALIQVTYDMNGTPSFMYQSLKDVLIMKDIYSEECLYFFKYLQLLFFNIDKEELIMKKSDEDIQERKKRIEAEFRKIAEG